MPSQNYDNLPARVDLISIEGLGRTKDDYVKRFIQELFNVKNFTDLSLIASEVGRKLEKIGCFNAVEVIVDTSKHPDATPTDYEVTYVVKESKRFAGGVSTMIGSNEGSIVLSTKLPNAIGRGERIQFEHEFGSNNHKSLNFTVTKPLPQITETAETSASLFQNKLSNMQGGFNVYYKGGLLDFCFGSIQHVKHNLQWEATWREFEASSRLASFGIREQSGHSFKSSLRHIITIDHRDQPIFPNSGILLRIIQEYAGIGGDVAFLKNESDFQFNLSLPFDMVLQSGLRVGVFKPIDSSYRSTLSSDLFYLGGPQTLRGFEMRSVGPRSGNDVLGGKTFWTSGIHLYSPLPFGFGKGSFGDYCRTHFFFNAGNIIENSFDAENVGKSLSELVTNYKAAYGLGLAIRLGQLARIEINYCWPFNFSNSDKLVRGLQFGIGLEFI